MIIKACNILLKIHFITQDKHPEKITIVPDKWGVHIYIYFFSIFLQEIICCGYSLKAPRRDASNMKL